MSSNSSAAAGFGDSVSPIVNKNHWRGVLFKYGPKPIQVAFKTGDYKQQVIFIGGLTDGFLATDGYGTSNLKQDAMELDQLISHLINKEDSEGVVLLGHSTACQNIVHYMRTNAACSRAVRAAICRYSPINTLLCSL
nr:hypothetical protein CFP56_68490 [Quercus suber]